MYSVCTARFRDFETLRLYKRGVAESANRAELAEHII